ncbi:MAG: hypothetical protein ABW364_00665, partial [Rhodococcus fascians]
MDRHVTGAVHHVDVALIAPRADSEQSVRPGELKDVTPGGISDKQQLPATIELERERSVAATQPQVTLVPRLTKVQDSEPRIELEDLTILGVDDDDSIGETFSHGALAPTPNPNDPPSAAKVSTLPRPDVSLRGDNRPGRHLER